MKSRLLVAMIAVPVLFVILFFLPPVVLAVVTAALCAVAAVEFLRAVCGALSAPVRYMTVAAAALMPLTRLTGNAGAPVLVGVAYLLALSGAAVIRYEKQKEVSVRNLLACMFAALIYPTLMGTLNGLKSMENGRLLVLLPVIITFCCDSAAYFAGVYLGKKKITPLVSPHKSLEGFLGGLVGGLACVMIYGLIVTLASKTVMVHYGWLAVYAVLGCLACELGDLAFSLIKRLCGVKDYGRLIPGHGGVLDRFDSMSFVAPLIYALVLLIPAMG
ncbi:MAG: phosphatidate cytidylyltransferase [Oscillospiraceae bacterium]|nr:phosphatidate cytidylyltransferase [Oscillospiraceae bacterium]